MNVDLGQASQLRDALVGRLERQGSIHDPNIAAAMRAVPRHQFVTEFPLTTAYRDEVVPVKSSNGEPISTLSQPSAIATMLEQLRLQPGHRVLEIGAGTGYNAALIAAIVGHGDLVSTIELDDDLAAIARANLKASGFADVRVITRDGFAGAPEHAPFDRIELSVASRLISPNWVEQLVEGGVLVGPIHVKGLPFLTPAVRKEGDRLVSESIRACTFVPMRGKAAIPAARFRLPVRPELRFTWESNDEFPAGLLMRILKKPSRPYGEIPVAWSAAMYLLLTRDNVFYAETEDRRHRGISLFDRRSESLAAVISSSDGWGGTTVVVYGDDDAYTELITGLDEWAKRGHPGLEALQLTFVPSSAPMDMPDAYRIAKPYFDCIASYRRAE